VDSPSIGETYKAAGVDISAGEETVKRIKNIVQTTYRKEVVGDIGGFGGLFDISDFQHGKPILVSSTDGVGTKALIATKVKKYDTIGIDLVAMCVDDLVCIGAEPLFFLDYISVGSLNPGQVERLVTGISAGCVEAGCSLIGGEMAEHPGTMEKDAFDLVGFSVGMVDANRMITGEKTKAGDVVIGIHSPGLRSNGYSLARRLLFDIAQKSLDDPAWEGSETTLADELLLPSVIYTPAILHTMEEVPINAIAHITGGGLPGNLNRVLPSHLDAIVDRSTWEVPRIFRELQAIGNVSQAEMENVFNMGIGMTLIVEPDHESKALSAITEKGHQVSVIGTIADSGTGSVRMT
jgi:phosphoribosylformylglycinamidine cyclo-ligase